MSGHMHPHHHQNNQLHPDIYRYRSFLYGIAYRMLADAALAEDVLHTVFLKTQIKTQETQEIQNTRAWLCRITINTCLDILKSAAHQREVYIGTWLPSPYIHQQDTQDVPDIPDTNADIHTNICKNIYTDIHETLEQRESLHMAFLLALQYLDPQERAVFILGDIFSIPSHEIGAILEKSADAVRQQAARIRKKLEKYRQDTQKLSTYPSIDDADAQKLLGAFLTACASGDPAQLKALLAHDAAVFSDGGGKVPTARHPIFGAAKVAAFLLGLAQKLMQNHTHNTQDNPKDDTQDKIPETSSETSPETSEISIVPVFYNQQYGFAIYQNGNMDTLTLLECRNVDGSMLIVRIDIQRNPDKLIRSH